jgi:hypothetical protein
MATRIIGDLHTRKEEPFKSAVKYVFKQLELAESEEEGSIIQLGDFFNSKKPFPGDYEFAMSGLATLAEKNKIYIMAGNNAHEYHFIQKTWAIDPLILDNVELIKFPICKVIENKTYLFLPWIPQEVAESYKAVSIEDLYSNIGKFITLPEKIDYVLYHIEDETVFMGGVNHGIDLTYLEKAYPNIKRIGGHIHLQSENYLGTPYQTRYDEKGQIPHYLLIDGDEETYQELNLYFKYIDIDYEDELDESWDCVLLTVKNAPSVQAAYDKFTDPVKKIYFRDVQLKIGEQRETTMDMEEKDSSVKELMVDYLAINKVDDKTSKYLLKLF